MRSSFAQFDGWWHENHASAVLVAVAERCPAFASALLDLATGSRGEAWTLRAASREVTALGTEDDDDDDDDDEDDDANDPRRRIDVLFSAWCASRSGEEGVGRWVAAGIEVKLDAPFRPGQLAAYHSWLNRFGGAGGAGGAGGDTGYLAALVPAWRVDKATEEVAALGPNSLARVITWNQVADLARAVPADAAGRDWATELVAYVEDLMGDFTGLSPDIAAVAQTGRAMDGYLHLLRAVAERLDANVKQSRLLSEDRPWQEYDCVSLYVRCKRRDRPGWLSLTSYDERRADKPIEVHLEAQFGRPRVASVLLELDRLLRDRTAAGVYLDELAARLATELDKP